MCIIAGRGDRYMIQINARDRPGTKDRSAMTSRVKNKISRLYDKPLASSLTALAILALSIFTNISLS